MQHNMIVITLLCITVGCSSRGSVSNNQAEDKPVSSEGIEERILVPSRAGTTSQLYLVLTAKGDAETRDSIVVRNAREAIDSLDEFGDSGPESIVVFFIRPTKDSKTGAISGFSRAQLKELLELPEDKAIMKASEHAWTFGEKPEKRQNN